MKIKDIVNRNLVNLQNCESEPVHIPGSIQPHGFLLALNDSDYSVEFCSENIFEFIGITHEQVLGKRIDLILEDQSKGELINYISRQPGPAEAPLKIAIANIKLECSAHRSVKYILLELEPESPLTTDDHALYLQTRQFINNIETSNSLKSLCQSVADDMRQITGYDRVMIYKFDDQYNGEVYAESAAADIEPFLGLHYPHTDIPAQARELYLRNLMRMIVDVNYTPVPVYTIDRGDAKTLDMSYAGLRSVSPIHIQYLQNMGVGATLTISLVHEQRLWGLIACHHYSPKYLTNKIRVSAKLQGHFLTSQIKVREANEEYAVAREVDQHLQSLLNEEGLDNRNALRQLVQRKELLEICHSTGVAIILDNIVHKAGETPAEEKISNLIDCLYSKNFAPSVSTDRLSGICEEGLDLQDTAAGIIFHSLGSRNNSIIWFRHETIKEVHWGGDPQKAILKDERGLHPRKSFALWREIVKGSSNPWLRPELDAAERFTHFLQIQLHLIFLTEEEAKYRELSHKLQDANAELENLNWISAHDLKEPLRKIQVFASRILESNKPVPDFVKYSVERMSAAARRMQSLVYDILSYSRVAKIHEAMKIIDLNAVIVSVLDELKDDIEEVHGKVSYDRLPRVEGVAFLLSQVFTNLLQNALKFHKENVAPIIHIGHKPELLQQPNPSLSATKRYYEITVSDNGIGFKKEFNEKVFDIFTRLHHHDQYGGSGIGLALCRRIIANHGGIITAEGEEENGTTFTIYLPATE